MRKVFVHLIYILNGDMILLEKKSQNWNLPTKELEENITSSKSSIIETEKIFQQKFEDFTQNYNVEYDSLIKPWKTDTTQNITLHHGSCFTSDKIPQTKDGYYWTPIETLEKINIDQTTGKEIKQFIHTVNTMIEQERILKLYKDLYHDVT